MDKGNEDKTPAEWLAYRTGMESPRCIACNAHSKNIFRHCASQRAILACHIWTRLINLDGMRDLYTGNPKRDELLVLKGHRMTPENLIAVPILKKLARMFVSPSSSPRGGGGAGRNGQMGVWNPGAHRAIAGTGLGVRNGDGSRHPTKAPLRVQGSAGAGSMIPGAGGAGRALPSRPWAPLGEKHPKAGFLKAHTGTGGGGGAIGTGAAARSGNAGAAHVKPGARGKGVAVASFAKGPAVGEKRLPPAFLRAHTGSGGGGGATAAGHVWGNKRPRSTKARCSTGRESDALAEAGKGPTGGEVKARAMPVIPRAAHEEALDKGPGEGGQGLVVPHRRRLAITTWVTEPKVDGKQLQYKPLGELAAP
jgi:hypothetical protein